MAEALEAELDTLFQLLPAELVAARNALVTRLKQAGDKDGAARVKALKRPAPAAWAINQVFFRERALLESALADVAQVRELQATDGVDRQQLAAAVATQRSSLQAVVDAALRYCSNAGLPASGIQERRIFATVHGWLGGSGREAPGRMQEELEPTGFEGLGSLGTPSPLPAAGSGRPAGSALLAPPSAADPKLKTSLTAADRARMAPLPAAGSDRPAPLPTAGSDRTAPLPAAGSAPTPLSAADRDRTAPLSAADRDRTAPLSAADRDRTARLQAAGKRGSSDRAAAQQLRLVAAATSKTTQPAGPTAEELAARAREQAEALVRERKQAAAWARERLVEKREKLVVAEQAVERARREVEDTERALADRRSRLHEREEEQTRRGADLEAAERAQSAADEALAKARAELAKH